MSVSDRFFILRMQGQSATGLYAAAGRLPALLSFVIGVFLEAWHYAVLRIDAGEHGRMFSRIYRLLLPVLLFGGALLSLLAIPLVRLLLDSDYIAAARFVPLLLFGAVCGGLSNYLDSIPALYRRTHHARGLDLP